MYIVINTNYYNKRYNFTTTSLQQSTTFNTTYHAKPNPNPLRQSHTQSSLFDDADRL